MNDKRIGEVAELTSLSQDTLRYYERIGLIDVPKSANGYRCYNDTHIANLRFIKNAQHMDFTLAEIGQLLALRRDPDSANCDVRALACDKLDAIDQRLQTLLHIRNELSDLIRICRDNNKDCPILARLDTPS